MIGAPQRGWQLHSTIDRPQIYRVLVLDPENYLLSSSDGESTIRRVCTATDSGVRAAGRNEHIPPLRENALRHIHCIDMIAITAVASPAGDKL